MLLRAIIQTLAISWTSMMMIWTPPQLSCPIQVKRSPRLTIRCGERNFAKVFPRPPLKKGCISGHGTYVAKEQVIASVAGSVERVNKLVTVRAVRTR